MRRTDALVTLLAGSLWACSGAGPSPSTPSAVVAAEAAQPSTAPAGGANPFALGGGHGACGDMAAEHDCAKAAAEGGAHDCGAMGGGPVKYPDHAIANDASGARVVLAGARLDGAPVVSVAELLAHPEAYAGKTVRIEGNVSAMCQHRRAWFAVQAPGRSTDYVRVITEPSFLVPENAVGTRARAEGVVEVIATAPAETKHFESEHQLAAPASGKAVVVHASGAEFL